MSHGKDDIAAEEVVLTIQRNVLGIMLLAAVTVLCSLPSAVFGGSVVKIGGVGSALGSIKLVAHAFEKAHPDIKVEILPSLGSTGGIKAVVAGAIDIGLSGRPLTEGERRKGVTEMEYARTPFFFVAHKDVNVSGVTVNELIEIYEGKRLTWSDGTRIRLVLRPESDTDTAILKRISPEMDHAVKTALLRPGMTVAITNQESDDIVESTRGSLGASTLAQVVSEKRSCKILSFNHIQPGIKSLADGTYPLFKTLYVITSPRTPEAARRFITFTRSPAGKRILADNGNVVVEERPRR